MGLGPAILCNGLLLLLWLFRALARRCWLLGRGLGAGDIYGKHALRVSFFALSFHGKKQPNNNNK